MGIWKENEFIVIKASYLCKTYRTMLSILCACMVVQMRSTLDWALNLCTSAHLAATNAPLVDKESSKAFWNYFFLVFSYKLKLKTINNQISVFDFLINLVSLILHRLHFLDLFYYRSQATDQKTKWLNRLLLSSNLLLLLPPTTKVYFGPSEGSADLEELPLVVISKETYTQIRRICFKEIVWNTGHNIIYCSFLRAYHKGYIFPKYLKNKFVCTKWAIKKMSFVYISYRNDFFFLPLQLQNLFSEIIF